jgi:hypothetical protein
MWRTAPFHALPQREPHDPWAPERDRRVPAHDRKENDMRMTRRSHIDDIAAVGYELSEDHMRLAAGGQDGATGPELAQDVTMEQFESGTRRNGKPRIDFIYDGTTNT